MLPEVLLYKLSLANSAESVYCKRSLPVAERLRVEAFMDLVEFLLSTNKFLVPGQQRAARGVSSAGPLAFSSKCRRRKSDLLMS